MRFTKYFEEAARVSAVDPAAATPVEAERFREFIAKYGRKSESGDTFCLESADL